MLKSCLLGLETFSNKRTMCLDEIRKIIRHIVDNKEIEYNETIKRILYTGIKTLYTSIEKDEENLKEVLEFNGT